MPYDTNIRLARPSSHFVRVMTLAARNAVPYVMGNEVHKEEKITLHQSLIWRKAIGELTS